MCTGDELTASLLKQLEPFDAKFHLGEEVAVVRLEGEEFYLETVSVVTLICKIKDDGIPA